MCLLFIIQHHNHKNPLTSIKQTKKQLSMNVVRKSLLAVPWYSYEWKKRNFWDLKIIRTFILKNCTFLPQISTESFSRTFIAFHGKRLPLLHLLLLHHRLLWIVTMKDRNSIFNLASHSRQFKCSITKHLPLAMQIQTRTLLKIANKLYKQGTRIQWKIINADETLCWRWASP